MDDMDSLVREFLVESHENLDRLDRDLLALEKDPLARDVLDSIFRTIHTIKGTCGFLGFTKLEKIAHVGESVLARMREGALSFNTEIASVLLTMVDAIRAILAAIETAGNEGDGNYAPLIENITRLQDIAAAAKAQTASAASAPEPAAAPEALRDVRAAGVSDASIRVDVGLLDKLMNLVGELVLARNQILQFTTTQKDGAFVATTQRLNLITTELQESVMKTRMQPIGNLWSKFPRVVRDLANTIGKQVLIEMEGKETDLDKTIIEAIKDPLTHLVRNSVDHGIEPPDVRAARGKARGGRLFLRAFHEGGQVNIEISDDGGGIDPEKVKKKALQRGIIAPDQAARMGEREAVNLIFLPGFSTAEQVTNVSGRGVGMDVVKRNIERIGGTVDVQSKVGQGTTVKIKIPLTLAIIPALIVMSDGDRYAIPQVSLLELVRLEGAQAQSGIEIVHDTPVYRLRGNLLPLVQLHRQLGGAAQTGADVVNIVVLQADEKQFGLVVDSICDTEEIVVKPLSKHLKNVEAFAGATIMGDGRVALILDVLGIARMGGVVSASSHDRALLERAAEAHVDAGDRQSLLVCGVGDRRVAIPLLLVARLEELPTRCIERSGAHEVVQYRNRILPLVRIAALLGTTAAEPAAHDRQHVVVYADQERLVGLVVDRIIDIVEESVVVKAKSARQGIAATIVVQQKVTDLLDLHGLLANARDLVGAEALAGA
ncbi:MAG: chemotaxis protein CheA [Planctomycetota bacterium]